MNFYRRTKIRSLIEICEGDSEKNVGSYDQKSYGKVKHVVQRIHKRFVMLLKSIYLEWRYYLLAYMCTHNRKYCLQNHVV
jgi:hypothetical protein